MKKVFMFIVALFLTFSLASCGNGGNVDTTLKLDWENKELYNNYLKNIEFKEECIKLESYDTKATRFDVYLPKDIKGSSMYSVTSVEEQINDKLVDFSVSYNSFSYINSQNGGTYILNLLQNKKDDIKSAYGDFAIYDDAFTAWTHKIYCDKEAVEGKTRELLCLYLPIKVEYFTAIKDQDAKKTLETYMLVPVMAKLDYNDVITKDFSEFKVFNFTIKDGLLA